MMLNQVLNLSNNRIKKLPNNLQHLTSLVHLDVSSNKYEDLKKRRKGPSIKDVRKLLPIFDLLPRCPQG